MSKNSRNIDSEKCIGYADDIEFSSDGYGCRWLDENDYSNFSETEYYEDMVKAYEEEERKKRVIKMNYEKLAKCNEELGPVVDFYNAVAVVKAPYNVEKIRKTYEEISRKRKEMECLLTYFGELLEEGFAVPGYDDYDELYLANQIFDDAERVLNKMETWINDMDQ